MGEGAAAERSAEAAKEERQPSCSKFLYWIKAARYAGRARWRPKAADAPVYRPALGSPRQLSAQGQQAFRQSPGSNPTSPKRHHQVETTAAPAAGTATRRTPPAARDEPNSRRHHAVREPTQDRAEGRRSAVARVAHVTGARHGAGASWLTFGGSGPRPTRSLSTRPAEAPPRNS